MAGFPDESFRLYGKGESESPVPQRACGDEGSGEGGDGYPDFGTYWNDRPEDQEGPS